ncbi:hypothetical protein C8J56DRAFT_1139964 [Mycena floridula]|nr:hypothetical protein C8J56DRAFT_1139964 [Mycena floridula]
MHIDFHVQSDRPTMMVVIVENFDSLDPTTVNPEDHQNLSFNRFILLLNPTSTTVFNLRDRTVPLIIAYIWLWQGCQISSQEEIWHAIKGASAYRCFARTVEIFLTVKQRDGDRNANENIWTNILSQVFQTVNESIYKRLHSGSLEYKSIRVRLT